MKTLTIRLPETSIKELAVLAATRSILAGGKRVTIGGIVRQLVVEHLHDQAAAAGRQTRHLDAAKGQ